MRALANNGARTERDREGARQSRNGETRRETMTDGGSAARLGRDLTMGRSLAKNMIERGANAGVCERAESNVRDVSVNNAPPPRYYAANAVHSRPGHIAPATTRKRASCSWTSRGTSPLVVPLLHCAGRNGDY